MNPEQWRDYKSALAQDLEQADALPFNAYTEPRAIRGRATTYFLYRLGFCLCSSAVATAW